MRKKQGTYVLEVSSESIYFRFTVHRCTPAGGPGGEKISDCWFVCSLCLLRLRQICLLVWFQERWTAV